MSIYDVELNELIERAAQELKKIDVISPPKWAAIVKTGVHKERPPVKSDWWYTRCAAILRSVYKLGPIGVSKLRTKYGGKMNRGHKKEHFFKGSGNILRKALQQLEKAGLIKQVEKGIHKGKIATPKGKSLLDKIAVQLSKGKYQKPVVREESAAEEKKAEVKEKKPKQEKAEPSVKTNQATSN